MNQEERFQIGQYWIQLAQVYGKTISQDAMVLILGAIEDLEATKVLSVLKDWAKTNTVGRPPYPAEIRNKIIPKIDSRDYAVDTASRVRQAITKFGFWNPTEAREFVGNEAWHVIERFGGWQYICENLGVNLNETTFMAQFRDVVSSTENLKSAGIDINYPSIGQRENKNQISSSEEIIHSILQKM